MSVTLYFHFNRVGQRGFYREHSKKCKDIDAEDYESINVGSTYEELDDVRIGEYIVWDIHAHCLDLKKDTWEKHVVLIPKQRWLQ